MCFSFKFQIRFLEELGSNNQDQNNLIWFSLIFSISYPNIYSVIRVVRISTCQLCLYKSCKFKSLNNTEYLFLLLKLHSIKASALILYLHTMSCDDMPQQNGVTETKNKHILEVAQALFQNVAPKYLWGESNLNWNLFDQ